jgi:hypothetical protein
MVVDPSHAALGMALPATAEPTGKASERTKGNVWTLQPGKSVHFGVEAGALDKDKTTKMAAKIAELLESSHKDKENKKTSRKSAGKKKS